MPLDKLTAFTKKVQDLADKPNATMSAAEVKAQFDAAPNELRVAFNQLIDDLASSVDGDSGADNIAVTTIAGLTGASVQAVLESLKTVVDSTVLGQIPDGSITEEKLAFEIATNAESVSIADVAGHFTGTNVETVLAELFQFADSVHQDWTDVIGFPLLKADTSAQKKSKTQTIKNDLATNLSAKGQSSVGTETLDALIDKVSLIPAGKKWASGTITCSSTSLGTVAGLDFLPSSIMCKSNINTALNNLAGAYTSNLTKTMNLSINQTASAVTSGAFSNVILGGFKFTPADTALITYDWIAYE